MPPKQAVWSRAVLQDCCHGRQPFQGAGRWLRRSTAIRPRSQRNCYRDTVRKPAPTRSRQHADCSDRRLQPIRRMSAAAAAQVSSAQAASDRRPRRFYRTSGWLDQEHASTASNSLELCWISHAGCGVSQANLTLAQAQIWLGPRSPVRCPVSQLIRPAPSVELVHEGQADAMATAPSSTD